MHMNKLVRTVVEDDVWYVLALLLLSVISFNLGLLIGWIWILAR